MTMNGRQYLGVALALLLWPAVAGAEVLVALDAVPRQTLPGVPVTLQIRVENTGTSAVTLRNGAELVVTPDGAASFVAADRNGPLWAPLRPDTTDDLTLQAGEARTFHQSPGCSLAEQLYFFDARLSFPGSYSLRVNLYVPGTNPETVVSSTAATITVTEPAGADAAVWTRMQQLAASRGHSGFSSVDWIDFQFALADEIYSTQPTSNYLPYVACFKRGATPEQRIAFHQQALALNPDGPIADVVKLGIAGLYQQIADHARATLDVETAVTANAEARRIAQEVGSGSAYAHIRDDASRALHGLETEADLRRVIDILRAERGPSATVIPIADCVQVRKNGAFTARFGYDNAGLQSVTVPAGSAQNLISPPTDVRKQPSVFKPGEHDNVFRVESTGHAIVWTLLGRTAPASPSSRRCGGNPHD
jgi:hypothetical protein